jgi:hypothetical protein
MTTVKDQKWSALLWSWWELFARLKGSGKLFPALVQISWTRLPIRSDRITATGKRHDLKARGDMGKYSTCNKCKRPWNMVKGHSTKFNEHSGCFPLCEECWASLTPETRMPYYEMLIADWSRRTRGAAEFEKHLIDAENIRAAVMAGK